MFRGTLNVLTVFVLLLVGSLHVPSALHPATPGDFVSFVVSGEAARQGLDPHAVYPATSSDQTAEGVIYGPNINLPPTVLVYEMLPPLDISAAANVWRLLTVAMFLAAVAMVWRTQPAGVTPMRLAWLFGGPFLWITLSSAQIYGALILMTVAAWLLLERGHSVAAGVLMGLLACVKPQFALWPVFLLLTGHRRVAIASLLTAAAMLPLPAILHGPAIYLQWWADANQYAPTWTINNLSIAGPLTRAGLSWLFYPAAGVLIGYTALWALRRRPRLGEVSTVALILSLVLSPVTWAPYLLVLLPALLSPRRWGPAMTVGAVLLAIPGAVLSISYIALPAITGWAYPAGLLLISHDITRA